ncbi:AAA family ATPase [Dactylosporangium sp. NPDC051541]|uniref:AAA family ATPase n=1 Tax=Dactylosporangium sp. NPDC051541 TaxID=3363977 RepID=UPI0037B863F6
MPEGREHEAARSAQDCARSPTLVVIRGNSGSGKTTIAREVRRRYGRGCALLEQDHLRRVVLREHDRDDVEPTAPAFIAATARTALELGHHVVLEGILRTARYGAVLRDLIAGHPGPSSVFYLDIPFDETVRRHAGRAHLVTFTPQDMRGWYLPGDRLGGPGETTIGADSAFEDTVAAILHGSGLAGQGALTPCPVHCPRCAEEMTAGN